MLSVAFSNRYGSMKMFWVASWRKDGLTAFWQMFVMHVDVLKSIVCVLGFSLGGIWVALEFVIYELIPLKDHPS